MGKYKYYYLHPVKSALAKRKRILYHVALFGSPLLFLLVVTVGGILAPHSYAASYTWDGGGTTNNWSDCANWSSDICPVAADSVTFNSTSTKNSTIDASWGGSLTGLTIASGYTGTITMARSLTMSGAFSQAAGSFTAANQTLDLNSSFALSAGNFTASSGVMTVAGAFTISGTGAFNANGGTLTFDGTSSITVSCNNASFNLVTIANTAGSKTISSNCTLPLGTNPTTTGTLIVAGAITGSGTLTVSGLTMNSGASLSGFSGFVNSGAVTISTTTNFGSYTTFDANAAVTLNSGAVFTAPSGTATFANSLTINTGVTFSANGGTITFDGTSGTITCNSAVFNAVRFSGGGSYTVNNGCTLPIGANPAISSSSFTLTGTLSGTGSISFSGAVSVGTGASLSGFTAIVVTNNLSVSGTVDLSALASADVNGSLSLASNSTFTAPTGNLNIANGMTIPATATFNANGGTVIFDGTGVGDTTCSNPSTSFNLVVFAQPSNISKGFIGCTLPLGNNPTIPGIISLTSSTLTGTGTLTTNRITLNSTSTITGFTGLIATGSFTAAGTIDLSSYTTVDFNDTFTLNSGAVLTAPSGTATFASTFTLNSGSTFNANGGTVTFDGATTATLTCNSAVFNLVTFAHTGTITKTISSGCNFPLGNNPTVTGRITLAGSLSGTGLLTLSGAANTLNTGAQLTGFSDINAASLTLSSVTIDFSSYNTITSGSYNQTGGTVTGPAGLMSVSGNDFVLNSGATFIGNGNMDINNRFTLQTGSTFTAPTGNLNAASDFTVSTGVTFSANGGTVIFDGASGTITCNNATFNAVRFDHSASKTVSAGCVFNVGNDMTTAGAIVLNGTLNGTGTFTSGNLSLNATSVFSGFTGVVNTGGSGMTITGITFDASNYTVFDINASFTLASGAVFTAPPVMSAGFNFRVNTGTTFNANGGTVVHDGVGTFTCNGAVFNLVQLRNTGTVTVDSTCTLPLGNNPTASVGGSISNSGVLTGSGTLTSEGNLTINATGSLSGFTGLVAKKNLTAAGSTLDLSDYQPVTVGADLGITTAGTLIAPSGNMSVGGRISKNSDSFFNHNFGTVTLTGDNQNISGVTEIAFYNLTKTNAGTINFLAARTVTVDGKLTLTGPSTPISLISATPGSTWNINMQGTTNICNVSVTDSVSIGNSVVAYQSTSNSENPGWVFLNAACPGSGGGGGGGGSGGEPVSTVTNYINAQAAATAAGITTATPNTTLPPYYGLPSTLAKTVDTIPGSREALKAFLRFVAITVFIMLLAGGIIWLIAGKRRRDQEDDTFDPTHLPSSWNHTRVG